MSSEPWIGDQTSEPPGTCTYSFDPMGPKCGAPATTHILSESAIHGLVTLPTCHQHAGSAIKAGNFLDSHPHSKDCEAPTARWQGHSCTPVPVLSHCVFCGARLLRDGDGDPVAWASSLAMDPRCEHETLQGDQ